MGSWSSHEGVDLIRTIEGFGCVLIRHGAKHDWYRNPVTGVSQPVPRHREIKERLAQRIIRMLSNAGDGGSGSGDSATS
ncbi:MAG: type II toxin-antitoxin system HicA family toxin [Planctomycetes bacterium]|nr:type II toxin-antitoxin system HicA family toxin [Planctomycetota bacterium]